MFIFLAKAILPIAARFCVAWSVICRLSNIRAPCLNLSADLDAVLAGRPTLVESSDALSSMGSLIAKEKVRLRGD